MTANQTRESRDSSSPPVTKIAFGIGFPRAPLSQKIRSGVPNGSRTELPTLYGIQKEERLICTTWESLMRSYTTSRKKKASSRELGIFDAHLYDIQKEESTVCRWTNFDALVYDTKKEENAICSTRKSFETLLYDIQKEESTICRWAFLGRFCTIPRRKKA
jgi:hypothetical protein